jgi:hypothetical protein
VAPVFRTEMDFGRHQRFRTTLNRIACRPVQASVLSPYVSDSVSALVRLHTTPFSFALKINHRLVLAVLHLFDLNAVNHDTDFLALDVGRLEIGRANEAGVQFFNGLGAAGSGGRADSSGSLAMLAAIRRASSLVGSVAKGD